jgi:hypothetical protein
VEYALDRIPSGYSAYDGDDIVAVNDLLPYLPRLVAATRQTNALRDQLRQALAWLDAWQEGADLAEIEGFGLKGERLGEFLRYARPLLSPAPTPSSPVAEEPVLP